MDRDEHGDIFRFRVGQGVRWREAFPPLDEATRPGRMLRAARTRENVSQRHLAAVTGIPQHQIAAMEQGVYAIGQRQATQLAAVLNVSASVFLISEEHM